MKKQSSLFYIHPNFNFNPLRGHLSNEFSLSARDILGIFMEFFPDICVLIDFRERICKISTDKLAYCIRPSGGMADAGDLKSPARNGRVGSNPTSANIVFYHA